MARLRNSQRSFNWCNTSTVNRQPIRCARVRTEVHKQEAQTFHCIVTLWREEIIKTPCVLSAGITDAGQSGRRVGGGGGCWMREHSNRKRDILTNCRQKLACDRIFTSGDITAWENVFSYRSLTSEVSVRWCLCTHERRSPPQKHSSEAPRPKFSSAPSQTPRCARIVSTAVYRPLCQHIKSHTADFSKLVDTMEDWPRFGPVQEGNGTHPWIWTGSSQEKRTLTGCTLTHPQKKALWAWAPSHIYALGTLIKRQLVDL